MDSKVFENAYRHFREVCGRASDEQRRLLLRLMEFNKNTEYGRLYGFADIKSFDEYRSRVPLTDFSDYDGYLDRIIKGERDILTASPPVFFNISSGSVGEPKYIPITREDVDKHRLYAADAIAGIVMRSLPHSTPDELFGRIFNISDVYMTSFPDGRLTGVRSGVYLQSAMAAGKLDTSVYTAPPDIMFPSELSDMLYPKIRYALADGDVTAIHGVFVHRTAGLFRFIEKNLAAFAEDIRSGTVNERLCTNESLRNRLNGRFIPDPERANYLSSLCGSGLEEGMLLKLWPKLRYMRFIDGGQFSVFGDRILKYGRNVPVHSYIYAASESGIGLAPEMNVPGRYVLLPDVCFTEFFPEDSYSDRTLTADELETGGRYEIIITTLSGLYRYRIGDVVEVVGRYGESPVVRVCYRKGLIMNLSDERMNLAQLEAAFSAFERRIGITAVKYCFSGEFGDMRPRYVLYIEAAPALSEGVSETLDECLCEAGIYYKSERRLGNLDAAVVKRIKSGSFSEYDRVFRSGKRNDQVKPLRILTTSEQINFFEDRTEYYYGK